MTTKQAVNTVEIPHRTPWASREFWLYTVLSMQPPRSRQAKIMAKSIGSLEEQPGWTSEQLLI